MGDNIFEVDLTPYQVDHIEERLPLGYQFQLSFSKREKRKVQQNIIYIQAQIKKAVKFDANFQETEEKKQNPAMKKLLQIFEKLKSHPKFNEFEEQIIDQNYRFLDQIEQSFNSVNYTQRQFYEDVTAMFRSCYEMYAKNSSAYLTITILENFFKDCFKSPNQPQQQQQKVKEIKKIPPPPPQPMSYQEKKILGESIRKLPTEDLRGVWEIVQEGLNVEAEDGEELEFDLDKLPLDICRKLEKYVFNKMKRQEPRKKQKIKQTQDDSDILDVDQQ